MNTVLIVPAYDKEKYLRGTLLRIKKPAHTILLIRTSFFVEGVWIDTNFLFCGESIGRLAFCVKKKCIATYSVLGFEDHE